MLFRSETLLAIRARDLSYAEVLNAQDAIYQTAGLDSMPDEVSDQSVAGLASAIAIQSRNNELGHAEIPRLETTYVQTNKNTPKQANVTPVETAIQVANAPVSSPQDATMHPSVRLVIGRPWEKLGSLQGNPH